MAHSTTNHFRLRVTSRLGVDFKYTKNQRQNPKNRPRNIIWFNPPFNKAISTNIAKYFFDWPIDIFQSLIDYVKLSTETQWRLVTAVCKACSKYTKGIIVRLHPHSVTKWHYVSVEKNENVPWTVNHKLRMQFMTVVSLHQSHKKSSLGWQKENGSKGIITITSHSITNDIHMRRHFQVMCGIWRKL